MPILTFVHNIPEDLKIMFFGISGILVYKYILYPWNSNINDIPFIVEKLNSIHNTNNSLKSEVLNNLEEIDNCLNIIKRELEDLVEIKKELEKQSNSTNKIEIDFIRRFYEIENKLIKITTQLEPVLVSLKGIK